MSDKLEKVKVESSNTLEPVIKRIKELKETREKLLSIQSSIEARVSDVDKFNEQLEWKKTSLANATSDADKVLINAEINKITSQIDGIKILVDSDMTSVDTLQKKIAELSFKKSELKPALDIASENFANILKAEREREYHISLGGVDEKTGKNVGKSVYKELLSYLQNDVEWNAKTAVALVTLVNNMEENKAWTQAKEFDGVIILRSANVLSLWKCVMEGLSGKGSWAAKRFLTTWANCGQSVSDAIKDIQKENAASRDAATILNDIDSEYLNSIDDIVEDEKSPSVSEDVNPEV